MKILSKPSGQRLKNRALDYGSGVGAAVLMNMLTNLLGSSFWGSAGSAVIVGSIFPDERGTALTTILGFNAGLAMVSSGAQSGAEDNLASDSVM